VSAADPHKEIEMSVRAILVILLAILCGLSAAVGISKLRQPATVAAEPETTPIVVATVDITRGVSVTEDDIEIQDYPVDRVPEGALISVEQVVGRSVMIPLLAGDPVRDAKLADREAGRGISALIPKGWRAYTITTSKDSAKVAGFLLPGDKVDILYTSTRGGTGDETGGGSTTTLFQNVEILAAGQYIDAPTEKSDPRELNTVTLLITPDVVPKLDLAQATGNLSLSLRNPEDEEEANTRIATVNEIRFAQQPMQPPIIVPVPVPQLAEAETGEGEPASIEEPKKAETKIVGRIRTSRAGQQGTILIAGQD
jgi:pilus assembly protein CpaB